MQVEWQSAGRQLVTDVYSFQPDIIRVDQPEIRHVRGWTVYRRRVHGQTRELCTHTVGRCPAFQVYRLELALEWFDTCSDDCETVIKCALEEHTQAEALIDYL